jgi:hypothetical protein
MVSLPVITEVHTGDLTADCPRRVLLARSGKIVGTMPGAMYRGNLAGEALRMMHEQGREWTRTVIESVVLQAAEAVAETAKRENRPLTNAVLDNKHSTMTEVVRALLEYGARVAPRVHTLIGCELPIRWTIDVDGEPQEFASHLDILYRDSDDWLCFDDWKWRDDAPGFHYLSRNLQFASYAYALKHGSVLVYPSDGDEGWIQFHEWPLAYWIHLDALRPYGKAVTCRDDDGEERQFKRGDARPLRAIVRQAWVMEAKEQAIVDALSERVRMMRAGLWPAIPDPVGCGLCESNNWCPHFAEESDE